MIFRIRYIAAGLAAFAAGAVLAMVTHGHGNGVQVTAQTGQVLGKQVWRATKVNVGGQIPADDPVQSQNGGDDSETETDLMEPR